MLREKIGYETKAFHWFFFILLIISALSIDLMFLDSETALVIVPFSAFMTFIFVLFGITPMLVKHEVHDTYIVIRQGWYYHNVIDLSDIKRVVHVAEGPFNLGVHFAGDRMLIVNGRMNDLILLELDDVRHRNGKKRRMTKILFDTRDNARFMKAIGKDFDSMQ